MVVQDGGDVLGIRGHCKHDAQRVQDAGLAGLVILADVRLG
jgi:hypothetical protein